jgi:hypothetical protein
VRRRAQRHSSLVVKDQIFAFVLVTKPNHLLYDGREMSDQYLDMATAEQLRKHKKLVVVLHISVVI